MKFEKLNFWVLLSGIIASVIILPPSILSVALLRVQMAPLPNIEPIMLFTLVTALALGPVSGFIFGTGSMSLSDFFMGRVGPWTIYTSLSFGLVGLLVGISGMFQKNKKWNTLRGRTELFVITFIMTVLWDLITATFFAFEFFIPLQVALSAQVPFTLLHLSNCFIVFMFAPQVIKVYSEAKEFLMFLVLKFFNKNKSKFTLRT